MQSRSLMPIAPMSTEESSSSTTATISRLQRKMDNLCVIVEKLLDATPRPMAILKEHITALEDLIADLPEEESWAKLVDQYRDAVVCIWQRYENGDAKMCAEDEMHNDEGGGSRSLASDNCPVQDKLEDEDTHLSPVEAGVPSRKSSSSSPFSPETAAAVAKYQLTVCSEPRPSPDEVRAVLRLAFDKLDHIDSVEGDIGAMKALLVLVTKARTLTMSYWKNNALLKDIFSYAFGKMPQAQRATYIKQYDGAKKWLLDLREFLQEQIDEYSMQRQLELENDLRRSSGGFGYGHNDHLKGKTQCFYCKRMGHLAAHCAVLKLTLCAKCLQFGHTTMRCPNGVKYVRLDDFY